MNGILGLTHLLLHETLSGQEQQKHLKMIRSSGKRLVDIINDILDFSKGEAGRFVLREKTFSLRYTVSELLHNLEVLAQEKGLSLRSQIADDVPDMLCGDGDKLGRILINLVGNGIKFTSVGRVQLNIVQQVDFAPDRTRLLFEVEDTGIGIPPAMQDKIFKSFTQVDSTHSRRYGGTGLGLSISRQLVRVLGGEVHFDSEPNQGTRFYFSLPFKLASGTSCNLLGKGKGKGKKNDSLSLLAGQKILLVDDDFINRSLAEILLTRSGMEVAKAANGLEALAAWKQGEYDCILMDVQMPEMDGYEAVAAIRKEERNSGSHIPIIAMTAHAMDDDRRKCLDAGMDDYISKPIEEEILLSILQCHLRAGAYGHLGVDSRRKEVA